MKPTSFFTIFLFVFLLISFKGFAQPIFQTPLPIASPTRPAGDPAQGMPSKEERDFIERKIIQFAEKNKEKGYTLKRDDKGFLMVLDSQGQGVPLPLDVIEMPGKPSKDEIEKRILEYVEKNKQNGLKAERDVTGFLKIKDQFGQEVPIPYDILHKEDQSKLPLSKMEEKIFDFANQNRDKGYTAERDEKGSLKVKNKAGEIVPLPLSIIESSLADPQRQNEILQIEGLIMRYAAGKGYQVERDPQGFLILKDKTGRVVPVPPEAIGLKPQFERTPIEIQELEKRISDFAKSRNFMTERNEMDHLVVKNQNGEIVEIPPEVFEGPPAPIPGQQNQSPLAPPGNLATGTAPLPPTIPGVASGTK